jgi:predicted esterase
LADEPENGLDQHKSRRVGLISTSEECVVVGAEASDSVSVSVYLEWEGQIEEAFLNLAAVGSEAGHSIMVNNQFVGSTPVRAGDQDCQVDTSINLSLPTDVIPIPANVLAKGENMITLTNDANIIDSWTAASLYLEIHGVLSGPSVAALELAHSSLASQQVGITASEQGTVELVSSYELAQGSVITQMVSYQIPSSYTDTVQLPLLIGLHGKGTDADDIRDFLAGEAEERGWLLAAPEMHGSFYINTGSNAYAWLGAQHDIIDTIQYMTDNYNVDLSRIYLAGESMGAQTSTMVAAKYPDIFAAVTAWKPLTNLAIWYDERIAIPLEVDTIVNETGGIPTVVLFEYERRSPLEIPQNSRLVPIKMWHDEDDRLVPIHHSQDLRNVINNNWNPPRPVTLIEIASEPFKCSSDPDSLEHCYDPDTNELFDYLEGFSFDSQPPISITIRTDESKPYYWLNIAQTGEDHWSQVEASYDLANKIVIATISDTHPLTLAVNLGSLSQVGPAGIPQAGIGLPDGVYQVDGGGNHYQTNYTSASGYLTVTLTTTGQYSLTISAVDNSANDDLKIYLPIVVK